MSRDAGTGTAAQRLSRLIDRFGSIPLSLFMAEANAAYYAARDPLGVDGDFITAPEISQMFGELIGLWAADVTGRAGALAQAHWVELGPGRGTLSADAMRACGTIGWQPPVHLVETSPVLRDLAAVRLPLARFHYEIATLPDDVPLVIIANEFFDALPVRQLVKTAAGWRERQVARAGDRFLPVDGLVPLDSMVPARFRDAPVGSILEHCPAGEAIMAELASRMVQQGGVLLAVDYGYVATQPGDTLQAISRHRFASPFDAPGEQDLTAHVDFEALGRVARSEGARVHGPVQQGAFLLQLGMRERAQALGGGEAVSGALQRLVGEEQMGALFKVLALTSPQWPQPEGFAA